MFFISSVKLHLLSIFNIIMFHLKPTPLSLGKIVNVHEKSSFLLLFFEISKWAETTIFWLKKIGQNHDNSVYKKALKSEHQKNYIFRDINCFVKMSVCTYAHYQIFDYALAQKFWNIKIKSWLDFGWNRSHN